MMGINSKTSITVADIRFWKNNLNPLPHFSEIRFSDEMPMIHGYQVPCGVFGQIRKDNTDEERMPAGFQQ